MTLSNNTSSANGVRPPPTRDAGGYGHYPLHDRSRRPLEVIVVGAGPSGIAALIELKKLPHVTIKCFEKNTDVGGTWFETRYPGAACDVASHAYQYSFDYKTDWSRHFAPAEEIGEYFISVAKKHELHKIITFNSRVIGAEWIETEGMWQIQVAHDTPTDSHAEVVVEELRAHVFINAGGILNDWKWPDIEGLHTFKGRLLHTAAWDPSIDLKGASVGVIGSGASSIQVVPSIQPACQKLDVYVRSPTYILPTVGFGIESSNFNEPYTVADIDRFNDDPEYYKSFRKQIEQQMNENFVASIKDSPEQEKGREWASKMMKSAIISPELREKLIPKWELGCRRLTPSLPYLKAIQEPNVNVIRTGIRRITEAGIETKDGEIHQTDVLICATGFNTSFSSRFNIIGRQGLSLRSMWKARGPEAYLGLAIAGLPNYFSKTRQTTDPEKHTEHSKLYSVQIVPSRTVPSSHALSGAITKIQTDQIRSMDVKQPLQDAFNDYVQEVHKDLVWTGSCNSWYKDRQSGRVVAVWPGSSIHFMEMIANPRWEDFNIDYINANPFMFMGNGISQHEAKAEDLTFYLDNMVPDETTTVASSSDQLAMAPQTPESKFYGGVAVITGAGGGLGSGLARRIASFGMIVIVADIALERAEEVASSIRSVNGQAEARAVDVSRPDELDALAKYVYTHYGDVQLLINNAAIETLGPCWAISAERWETTLNVNIHGVIHGVRAFLPRMMASGKESWIVNISSAGAFTTIPGQSAYVVTKHAVQAFTESLYVELKSQKNPIHVSSVIPGLLNTGIFDRVDRAQQANDPSWESHRQSMAELARNHGMDVNEASRIIVEQVVEGRFWISTHPALTREVLQQRIQYYDSQGEPNFPPVHQ
ncbi:hypothetical protein NW762_006516 [Fusarium torreyae]|uniref:Monooxygenase n=1 Tax=Fusarium torreyae TaxID=1237075 RepID=A0A9W8S193_9HYPO|nr:hypothetical protein NW762_006516 [Fusarium torreyae]